MRRLLIANRGEIALRIARTARELGLETVGIHAPEDAELAGGYGVDTLERLEASGARAYLDVEQIVAIARRQACDGLHPGYGFLSERPELARACEKAGILFVGPSPEALALFGDKAAARRHAADLGLPTLAGTDGPVDVPTIRALFESWPEDAAIVLKAVAGGGGRGLRVVHRGEDLDAAYERCRSEARRSFGSDAVMAERFVEAARHVEVQTFADASGQVGHLWERDCSLQRRHQKLVEWAPALGLDPGLRERLLESSTRLLTHVPFVGLATVEWLIDPRGEPYFLEVNPRLQVEHPVTEAITGVDLVEVQLRLAEGESLADLRLSPPPRPRGQALELRIHAETIDPNGEARPSSGRIEALELPSGSGVRIDIALRAGLAPDPGFDPLIAKLIVWTGSDDPERLLQRARRALDQLRIDGPATNRSFLLALLDRPELARGHATTGLVAQQGPTLAAAAGTFETASRVAPRSGERVESASGVDPDAAPEGLAAIRSAGIGTVLEIPVERGASVGLGDPIAILEAMKMEHVVTATCAGTIERICVAAGDVVETGQLLAWLRPGQPGFSAVAEESPLDLDRPRPDLEAVRARHARLHDESRPEAVERRRSRGQRTARENLEDLCDPDSFVEYGALAVAAQRRTRSAEELERRTPADGILTGFGTVNAGLFGADAARCALLVVDATVLAGTQGFYHHRKIDRILELAHQHATPVVFLPEGGGGRPNDTDTGEIVVAGLDVTSFHAFARLSGRVPRIAVVSGYCFAGSAAFAGCADVIIATRHTSLGMGGPAMIEGGGLGVHAPQDVGPTSIQAPNGVLDLLVEDEIEAVAAAKRVLAYFQGPLEGGGCRDQRTLRHLIPENRRRVYDVRAVIDTLCDEGTVTELRRDFGPGMITALVRIEGRPLGLLANDPMHLGGAIDDTGADKAARFLQLCDAFGLPVLSLCDTPGFMVGPEIEARAQVRKVSRMFVVGANLSVPVVTVVLRKAYGLGAQAMAGGSFLAPAITLAWPTGEIGGMGLEGAVRLGFQKQLAEQATAEAREALFEKLVGLMYERGKALNAASHLELDAVIDPAETRATVLRTLRSLGPIRRGSGRFVDTW